MAFHQVFDVIVVGGGLLGTAVARDCAMRRLSVLLIEQEDIGSGATEVISPLVDGGNRTWTAHSAPSLMQEFDILERLAPQLFSETRVLIPANPDLPQATLRRLQSTATTLQKMGSARRDRRVQSWTPEEFRRRVPFFSQPYVAGGVEYTQMLWDPVRFAIANAKAAEQASAEILLGARVEEVSFENGRVVGVRLRRGQGRSEFAFSKTVIVAAGAGASRIKGVLADEKHWQRETILFLAERLPATFALVSESSATFLIPWRNQTWVGSWSSDYCGNPYPIGDLGGDAALIDSRFLNRKGVSGLWRPSHLMSRVHAGASESSGETAYSEPTITDHSTTGHRGLFSLSGGNGGFCRLAAEKISHQVTLLLKHREECRTAFESLPGGSHDIPWEEEAKRTGLPPPVVYGIIRRHGYHATTIFQRALEKPELARTICECEGVIAAEVEFCVREEWATTLKAISRRTGLATGNCQGVRCALNAVFLLQRMLGGDMVGFRQQAEEWILERQASSLSLTQGVQAAQSEMDRYLVSSLLPAQKITMVPAP